MNRQLLEKLMEAAKYAGQTAVPMAEKEKEAQKLLVGAAEILYKSELGQVDLTQLNEQQTDCWNFLKSVETDALGDEREEADYARIAQLAGQFVNNQNSSKLSDYGYDMVVGITLGSVNGVMKEMLMNMEANPLTRYYVSRKNAEGKVYTDEANEQEVKVLEPLNLFSIPDDETKQSPEQKEHLAAARKLKIVCAFKAGFGIPEGVAPSRIGDILDFNTGETGNHTRVKYKCYFKEFTILQWVYDEFEEKYVYTRLEQKGELWDFLFDVNLSLDEADLEKVPKKVKDMIKNIDPGSMFSVQQLFLDLNTTSLQGIPKIENIDEEAQDILNRRFINLYFNRLKEEGGVIFGYTIKPSAPGHKNYFLKPTDFRFYISPYLENGTPVPSKKKLYTLNYLVMCNNHPVPSELRDFKWNWVEEKDYAYMNGIMSINKNYIFDMACNHFPAFIQRLLAIPHTEFSIPNPVQCSMRFWMEADWSADVTFNNAYSYSYYKEASADDWFFFVPPLWGNTWISHSVNAQITTFQSTDDKAIIQCRADVKTNMHINVEGGVSEGTVFDETIYFILEVDVDAYGKLLMTPTIKEVSNQTTFEISTWSQIVSFGTIEDCVNSVTEWVKNDIKAAVKSATWEFLNEYNMNAIWTLPGDETFSYRNTTFSEGQDLTFVVNYVKPEGV